MEPFYIKVEDFGANLKWHAFWPPNLPFNTIPWSLNLRIFSNISKLIGLKFQVFFLNLDWHAFWHPNPKFNKIPGSLKLRILSNTSWAISGLGRKPQIYYRRGPIKFEVFQQRPKFKRTPSILNLGFLPKPDTARHSGTQSSNLTRCLGHENCDS